MYFDKRTAPNQQKRHIKTMNKSDSPALYLPIHRIFLSLVVIMLLAALAGCATAPQPTATTSKVNVVSAYDMYNMRDYAGAVKEFNKIISDDGSSANNRRMANLGKAMIYLGTDENWYSLDNAKLALNSAGEVVPDGNSEFAVETDMLMDAILDLIGTESQLAALQLKSGNSKGEVAGLKSERDALEAERDALLAEQKALNDALEKLKELTLSN